MYSVEYNKQQKKDKIEQHVCLYCLNIIDKIHSSVNKLSHTTYKSEHNHKTLEAIELNSISTNAYKL